MRLICPNCGAQYEVPDEVIPAEGRDVQCSDCGQTWFQHSPERAVEDDLLSEDLKDVFTKDVGEDGDVDDEIGDDNPPQSGAAQPPRRALDPEIAEILREEAAREAKARAATPEPLESQPELGLATPPLDDAARRAREARDRMARMRGQAPEEDLNPRSRRDLLPDIEEINSTLRPSGERPNAGAAAVPYSDPADAARPFRKGFLTAVVIAAFFAGLYVFANDVTAAIPSLSDAMAQYTGTIEQMRVWLDSQVRDILTALAEMTTAAE